MIQQTDIDKITELLAKEENVRGWTHFDMLKLYKLLKMYFQESHDTFFSISPVISDKCPEFTDVSKKPVSLEPDK